MSLGHDEYWSVQKRDAVEGARDRGVNLMFLGPNAVYWRIRLEPSTLGPNRLEVNYRTARDDPLFGKDDAQVTTLLAFPASDAAPREHAHRHGVLLAPERSNDGVVVRRVVVGVRGNRVKNGEPHPGSHQTRSRPRRHHASRRRATSRSFCILRCRVSASEESGSPALLRHDVLQRTERCRCVRDRGAVAMQDLRRMPERAPRN